MLYLGLFGISDITDEAITGFKKLPENRGEIYISGHHKSAGKRSCQDCFSCNWCSDDHYLLCRKECLLKKIPAQKMINGYYVVRGSSWMTSYSDKLY